MSEFVAGAYTATYNAKALGQTADGYRFSFEVFKRIVTGDLGAQTPQDSIYQGMAMFLAARLIEADKAGILDLVHPYADTIGTPWALGKIGLLDVRGQGTGSPTVRAKQVVLTAVTGTTAANDMQATMTMPLAILAENFPVEVLLAPDLREVPIRLRIYPNMSTLLFGSQT